MNLPLRRSTLVTPPPSPLPMGVKDENAYPIQQNRKRKVPKKAVCFLPVVEVYTAPSPLDAVMRQDATNAWKKDLWFNAEDLAEIRNRARDLCRQMRSAATASASTCDNESPDSSSVITTCVVEDPETTTSTRGLERRACPDRQRRKRSAIRYIVKASSQLSANPNPSKPRDERLASLAQKCNNWATLLAIQEAERDYVRAYSDDLAAAANEQSRGDGEATTTTTTTAAALLSVPPPMRRSLRLPTIASQCSGGGALEETPFRRRVRRASTLMR